MNCFFDFLKRLFLHPFLPKKPMDIEYLKPSSKEETFSLTDLEKMGLYYKSVKPEKEAASAEIPTILASQIPMHLVPWITLFPKGVYQITFSPKILSQIQSGVLDVSGGVARNQMGAIVGHGKAVNSLLLRSPLILYQIGVIVFGASQLQAMNKSLKKINRKLDEISAFQMDKREAQINSYWQEFSHISKGVIDFSKQGNIKEVLSRVHTMKNIRMMNLSHLLHLQKNIKDQKDQLKNLKRSSWFFQSKEEYNKLMELVSQHSNNIKNYQRSLALDIALTRVEVSFSNNQSLEETKSRMSAQNEQVSFFKSEAHSFDKILNVQIQKLIKKTMISDNFKQKRKRVRSHWSEIKKQIPYFTRVCKKHIQSIECMVSNQSITGIHKTFLLENKESNQNKDQKAA